MWPHVHAAPFPLVQSRLLLLRLFPHPAPTSQRFWQTHDLFKAENELWLAAARSALPWGLAIFHHVCVAWRAAFSSPPRVGLPSFSRERRRGKKNERGRHDYFQVTGWFVLASVGALIVVEDATECNTSLKCKSLCMLKSLANNGVPLIGYVVHLLKTSSLTQPSMLSMIVSTNQTRGQMPN